MTKIELIEKLKDLGTPRELLLAVEGLREGCHQRHLTIDDRGIIRFTGLSAHDAVNLRPLLDPLQEDWKIDRTFVDEGQLTLIPPV